MNNPKILSNKRDKVPKIRPRYAREINENSDFRQQIIDAFDRDIDSPMGENDFFVDSSSDKNILDRFFSHNEKLPMEQIATMLRNANMVSCEIQRKKKEKTGWWQEAIWPAVPKNMVSLGTVLTRNNDENIKGHIVTYISFAKLNDKQRPDVKITAKQIEFPGEWTMLPTYVVFQKELTGEELAKEQIEL